MLASADPAQRHELAYSVLATWLSRDVLDPALRRWLGDEMARRLSAEHIWERSFTALILDALVTYGTYHASWLAPFERWYANEADLRGFDPTLGWLHAVAHGADLLGSLGRCVDVDPSVVLDLAARRLTAPSEIVWRDGEDERLGYAIALTLTRPELDPVSSIAWVRSVEASWIDRSPGPPPPWVGNAARTLRVVLGFTLTGVRPSGTNQPQAIPPRAQCGSNSCRPCTRSRRTCGE